MEIVNRQFDAFQSVVLGFKIDWTNRMFAEAKAEYDAAKADLAISKQGQPQSADDVAALLKTNTSAQFFEWFERHLQRLKYSGRWGLQTEYDKHRLDVMKDFSAPVEAILEVDDDFEQPGYYVAVDIHQHPGGVWSDEIAGAVYERGARSTTPLMQRDKDLHYRLTDAVLAHRPKPRRVLDMGCGFGKSTRPFVEQLPESEIVGIELSAPCLRFAAQDAASKQQRNVKYKQRDASRTGLEDSSFEVVTSTMLLHEMPPPVIRDLLAEASRLLEPGGLMLHLDFLPDPDPFMKWVHYGHGRRNNEPFMEPLDKMNILAEMERLGFKNVKAMPFEEAPGALDRIGKHWRFPWTIIMGEKAA